MAKEMKGDYEVCYFVICCMSYSPLALRGEFKTHKLRNHALKIRKKPKTQLPVPYTSSSSQYPIAHSPYRHEPDKPQC